MDRLGQDHAARVAPPIGLPLPAFEERAPWLGGDLQTMRNFLRRPAVDFAEFPGERLVLPLDATSGDRVVAAFNRPGARYAGPQRPVVALIHGLTGCADSVYMQTSALHFLRAGFPVLRVNLRGSAPTRALCRQHYHAGRSDDIALILAALPERVTAAGVIAVGFSLGGNLLLKYLGEAGDKAAVQAAAAISAPVDLSAAAHRIMAPRNALYHWYFLRVCQHEALAPGADVTAQERRAALEAESLWEFDDRFTAPRNGFASAEDYYTRNSSRDFLDGIAVPTIVIHAEDDPIVPVESHRKHDWRSNRNLFPVIAPRGGHVGFHDRNGGTWHDRAAETYFQRTLSLS